MEVNHSQEITGIHKFTGTLTFEYYGEPHYSTTDVFKYDLEQQFKDDPSFMLEGVEWKSTPIDIVTWKRGEYKNGKFVERIESDE